MSYNFVAYVPNLFDWTLEIFIFGKVLTIKFQGDTTIIAGVLKTLALFIMIMWNKLASSSSDRTNFLSERIDLFIVSLSSIIGEKEFFRVVLVFFASLHFHRFYLKLVSLAHLSGEIG